MARKHEQGMSGISRMVCVGAGYKLVSGENESDSSLESFTTY